MHKLYLVLIRFKQLQNFPFQMQFPFCTKLHLFLHTKLLSFLSHKFFQIFDILLPLQLFFQLL